MDLHELKMQVEDKAVAYLNEMRLEALEEKAINQTKNGGKVTLHKLEVSALLNAVRGLQRKRRSLEAAYAELSKPLHDASVEADAMITEAFGWPWNPTAQKLYAAFCTKLELAQRGELRRR